MRVQQLQLLELLATEPKHIQLMTDRVLQSKEYAALSMYVCSGWVGLWVYVVRAWVYAGVGRCYVFM